MPGKSMDLIGFKNALIFLCLPVLFLASCATLRPVADQPSGFAEFASGSFYQAVSPEGVALRIRSIENKPYQTLEFWAEALKVHLLQAGYALIAEDAFTAPVGEGTYFEWVAPVEGEDWVFLTALTSSDTDIILAEAAGEYALYQEYRKSIMTGIASIHLSKN
jgi:hypothetical protein